MNAVTARILGRTSAEDARGPAAVNAKMAQHRSKALRMRKSLTRAEARDYISANATSFQRCVSGISGAAVQVVIEQNGAEKALDGRHLLVAAGCTPNTAEPPTGRQVPFCMFTDPELARIGLS